MLLLLLITELPRLHHVLLLRRGNLLTRGEPARVLTLWRLEGAIAKDLGLLLHAWGQLEILHAANSAD
jgi:hypothetical protein